MYFHPYWNKPARGGGAKTGTLVRRKTNIGRLWKKYIPCNVLNSIITPSVRFLYTVPKEKYVQIGRSRIAIYYANFLLRTTRLGESQNKLHYRQTPFKIKVRIGNRLSRGMTIKHKSSLRYPLNPVSDKNLIYIAKWLSMWTCLMTH